MSDPIDSDDAGVTLHVDLSRGWQLEENLLAVATPPAGGLLACVRGCGEPHCKDPHMLLQLHDLLEGRPVEATVRGETLRIATVQDPDGTSAGAPLGGVLVHLPSGALLAAEIEPPVSDATQTRLAAAISGDILDALHALWLRLKGVDVDARPEVLPQDGGHNWLWQDIRPFARVDEIEIDGQIYEAFEQYCPDPLCQCAEAHLVLRRAGAKVELGVVHASIEGGTLLECECEPEDESTIERLFGLYRSRYPMLHRRLTRRYHTIKEVGREVARKERPRPARAAGKIGRNDPCPCGSGRKYKKCCMGSGSRN